METQQIQDLFKKYLENRCSADEVNQLVQLFQTADEAFLATLIREELNAPDAVFTELSLQQMADEVYVQLSAQINSSKKIRLWPRIAVAAAAVATIVFGIYFYNYSNRDVLEQVKHDMVSHDIAPGKNIATIKLANGKTIQLSDAKTGVRIADDKLIYNDGSSPEGSGTVRDNERNGSGKGGELLVASTPRGGTYQFTLPDGTKVWLNAASSIKFPAQFSGRERKILLSGEGYFEVAKDKAHPFIVQTDQQTVEVLGTHFNINSYADEAGTRTTLVEGSVRVSVNGHKEVLKPSQQSLLYDGAIKVQPANVEEVVAWKNGDFVFNGEPLQDIMRKLSRWYNIDVVYKGDVANELYTAKISRNKNISEVIQLLEQAESVHFKIEGRRVIVTP
ncbi:MAG TPA: FecR domain-containing protein [Pedobacter sp.]|nr:FecR domain-containing protein [Pedobacter sp.]